MDAIMTEELYNSNNTDARSFTCGYGYMVQLQSYGHVCMYVCGLVLTDFNVEKCFFDCLHYI